MANEPTSFSPGISDVSSATLATSSGSMTVREARKSKGELQKISSTYQTQISQLKELVGDYTDRLEFQQMRMQRNELTVTSAVAERAALVERAELLEAKYQKAQAALEELQQEQTDASVLTNPFGQFLEALGWKQ